MEVNTPVCLRFKKINTLIYATTYIQTYPNNRIAALLTFLDFSSTKMNIKEEISKHIIFLSMNKCFHF